MKTNNMKKIIALSLLAVTLASTSAFGQGYFIFSSGKSQVWDGFTTAGTSAIGATENTAFLWAAASTSTPMPLASTPTNGTSLTPESYTVAQAWTTILSGAFTLAQNSSGNTLVVSPTLSNGSISYNSGVSFGVTGTAINTTYSVFEIAWNSAYATPALAAANNSAVGWSSVFQYAAVDTVGFANTMPTTKFGVFTPASVPEPGTMALAALGGASLLLFRRRK